MVETNRPRLARLGGRSCKLEEAFVEGGFIQNVCDSEEPSDEDELREELRDEEDSNAVWVG